MAEAGDSVPGKLPGRGARPDGRKAGRPCRNSPGPACGDGVAARREAKGKPLWRDGRRARPAFRHDVSAPRRCPDPLAAAGAPYLRKNPIDIIPRRRPVGRASGNRRPGGDGVSDGASSRRRGPGRGYGSFRIRFTINRPCSVGLSRLASCGQTIQKSSLWKRTEDVSA